MFLLIGMVMFGAVIYYSETSSNPEFPSIIHSFWWVIVTMTTLGYGDMVPITWHGRIVGAMCAVCGVLLVAFSVPVIVNNFMRLYEQVPFAKDIEKLTRMQEGLAIGRARSKSRTHVAIMRHLLSRQQSEHWLATNKTLNSSSGPSSRLNSLRGDSYVKANTNHGYCSDRFNSDITSAESGVSVNRESNNDTNIPQGYHPTHIKEGERSTQVFHRNDGFFANRDPTDDDVNINGKVWSDSMSYILKSNRNEVAKQIQSTQLWLQHSKCRDSSRDLVGHRNVRSYG